MDIDDEASIRRVLAAVTAHLGAPLTPAQETAYRRLRRAVAERDAEAAAWTAELAARDRARQEAGRHAE